MLFSSAHVCVHLYIYKKKEKYTSKGDNYVLPSLRNTFTFFCKRNYTCAVLDMLKLSEEREYLNSFEFHKPIIYDVNVFFHVSSFVRCCAGAVFCTEMEHLPSDLSVLYFCDSCCCICASFLIVAYEFNDRV